MLESCFNRPSLHCCVGFLSIRNYLCKSDILKPSHPSIYFKYVSHQKKKIICFIYSLFLYLFVIPQYTTQSSPYQHKTVVVWKINYCLTSLLLQVILVRNWDKHSKLEMDNVCWSVRLLVIIWCCSAYIPSKVIAI